MGAQEKAAAVSPFEWRPELLLNVDEIDRQHLELLARARTLNEAFSAAAPPQEIEAKLSDLIGFTEMHFSSEEEAMRAHGYDRYVAHQATHRKLLDQIHLAKEGLLDGTVVPCQLLSRFMEAWTNHHITGADKRFATFLRSKSDA